MLLCAVISSLSRKCVSLSSHCFFHFFLLYLSSVKTNAMKTFILSFFFILFSTLTLSAQTFVPLQKVIASDRSTGALFGAALDISGNYAIVGAQGETEDVFGNNTLPSAGAAYILERPLSSAWQVKQKLVPSDREAADYFGGDVAINGTTAVVGAFDKNMLEGNTYTHAGAIYIFERDNNGTWNEVKKIVALDTGAGDHFGYKVAISGNYIIVGSPIDAEDENGNNTLGASGAAYIIEKDGNGNWNQVQKIVASDRAVAALFGASVDINGNYAIVGAYQEDTDSIGNNTLNNAGAAYLFERDGNGHWQQIQKLVAIDRAITDRFGIAVSIYGSNAIVGAYLEDEDEQGLHFKSAAGAAYVFKRDTNTGNWNQQKKLVSPDRDPNDYFGQSVFINNDYAIAGSQNETKDAFGNNALTTAGAGYLYKKDTIGNWNFLQKIVSIDRAAGDNLGVDIVIDADQLMIGAHLEDDDTLGNNPMNASGSAYFLKLCNATYSSYYDTACTYYTSPSGNYSWTVSGVFTDTIQNVEGCDSIITIHLTLNSTHASIVESVCESYTSPSGNYTWSSTGVYIDTLVNSIGCDSIITIHLTVNSNDTALYVNACTSYVSPSGNYTWTSSNTYLDTLINSHGCDSIITIHLSINKSFASISIASCLNYTSPSGNYNWTSSGTYTDTIVNAKGCDSIITIHLTIGSFATNATIYLTECENYISPSTNYIYTSSGTYIDTIANTQGCDSIITIHLTILNATTYSTITENVCTSYTSPSGNYSWTSSGIYTDTLTNSQLCDSIITINLSVNATYAVVYQTVCSQYISPSQEYTWTTSGIYTDTILNSNLCDSILTIHLTVANSFDTIYQTACNSYISPSGNYVWTSSNTYTDTIQNTSNCDSIITVVLTINSVDATVTQNGTMLYANDSSSIYQWIDCADNTPIQGAVQQQYTPIVTGSYALQITNNGCTDTSVCYTVIVTDISIEKFAENISVFPNPSSDRINIVFNNNVDYNTIQLINANGQVVYSYTIQNLLMPNSTHQFSVAEYSTGIYLLLINSDHQQFKSKLIIDNSQ